MIYVDSIWTGLTQFNGIPAQSLSIKFEKYQHRLSNILSRSLRAAYQHLGNPINSEVKKVFNLQYRSLGWAVLCHELM